MKWLWIVLVIIFISGCAVTYVCPDGSVVTKASECKEETPPGESDAIEVVPEEPEPVEEAPVVEEVKIDISPDVQEIIDGSRTIKSLTYMHYWSDNLRMGESYFIKGNLIKRKLADIENYYERDIDTVYLDMETKTAEAYCERSSKRCYDKNQPFEVKYADFYVKTPLDWVNEIVYARAVGSEDIENKPVTVIEFRSRTVEGKMWLRGAGVPMKVQIDNKTYEFSSLVVNSLSDEDVTHQELVNEVW
ncbi:hypothetical protein JXA85_07155 [Candidatus Woesearchaeota archaeon]|nr:hypothetical protein [Candidatus Woesearchaeota archaeon]